MPERAVGGGVDWSRLMEQFDGDLTLIREIVEAYAAETRRNVVQLPEQLARGNASEVRRQAHILGGAMRVFGMTAALGLAREIEARSSEGALDPIAALVDDLLAEARRVLPQLDQFVASGRAPVR